MIDRINWDEDEPLEDTVDLLLFAVYRRAASMRYLFRSSTYRKGNSHEVFERDLQDLQDDSASAEEPWLNDDEFLQKYRMSRHAFKILHDKIKDHPVFNPPKAKKEQTPSAHQLMTWLKYVGTEGSGASNSNQRNTFRISRGAAEIYRRRVRLAIRSLSKEYIHWPGPEERKVIAREIFQEYNFPHCVALADGTLSALAFEPKTEDAPDYSGRKFGYSILTMIFCDHKKKN